jgi:ribA/ribD-fused uncharacterized protein
MIPGIDQPRLRTEHLPQPADYARFHPFLKGVFSQWHHTPFDLHGHRYVTAEQWMMFAKARLFDDAENAAAILANDDPSVQKRLGALVRNFDQAIWDRWKLDIVLEGNRAKFAQNAGAARQLRSTGDAMLVEANPRDWIWGVGLSATDPGVLDTEQWRGTNLLGRILTRVRQEIASM